MPADEILSTNYARLLFTTAAILFSSAVTASQWKQYYQPHTMWQVLDYYGYDTEEKKQALEFLLAKAGVNTQELLHQRTTSDNELLAKIYTLVNFTEQDFSRRREASKLKERWEIDQVPWLTVAESQQVLDKQLKILGLLDERKPTIYNPDVICVLGGRKTTMLKRLNYAADQIASGKLYTKYLFLMAGERKATAEDGIDGTQAELEALAAYLKQDVATLTEKELMEQAFAQSKFKSDPILRQGVMSSQISVTVPDIRAGKLQRPGTESNIAALVEWLKYHPEVKTVTFVSNMPYGLYAEAVIHEAMSQILERHKDLEYEVIGDAAEINSKTVSAAIGEIGTQIKAKTPAVLEKLSLTCSDPELAQNFKRLYACPPTTPLMSAHVARLFPWEFRAVPRP